MAEKECVVEQVIAVKESVKKEKTSFSEIVWIFFCCVWLVMVTGYSIHSYVDYKIKEARAEIINEINKGFVVRDKNFSDHVRKSNANIATIDQKFDDVWRWRRKDVEISNSNRAIFESRINGLQTQLNESIEVDNSNIKSIDQSFEELWDWVKMLDVIETDIEGMSQLTMDTRREQEKTADNLVSVRSRLRDLEQYQSWLQAKYFSILRMPE